MAINPHDRVLKRPQIGTVSKSLPHSLPPLTPLKQGGLRQKLPKISSWLAIVIILIATGGLAGAGWLGLQLMVTPQTLLWINRFLPDWIPIPVTGLKPPQTMDAIQQELTQAGRIAGIPLQLGKNISFLDHKTTVADVLLPVLSRRLNCQSTCEQIVELRVYQSIPVLQREPTFQLLDQQTITGPDEIFVLAPLIQAGDVNQGSTRSLPLLTLNRFEGKVPTQGVWLNLSGRWLRGDSTIAYGKVLHYNPSRFHLHQMLEWSSPTGQEPVWQEITGGGLPELVIDQTVGMEPQWQIYQVKPRNFLPSPLQLEPLSLLEPAIDDDTYSNGLLLARSGLWSTGAQWLQSVQRRRKGQWSAAAQAQQALIQLHAQATQTQADKSWASPSQQVLANLVDGRWQRALTVFAANADSSLETAALLKADSGRLQNRVEAALRASPMQSDIRSWGALLLAARQGRNAAIVWLKKQPKSTAQEIARVTALIQRLEALSVEDTAAGILSPGQLVGAAEALSNVNITAWLKPQKGQLKLSDQQSWYRVQVASFQDGKRWRSGTSLGLPVNTSVDRLWKLLGLTADPPLSIVFSTPDGQQQTVSASIKAVRIRAGQLELLAAGDIAPRSIAKTAHTPRPLAFTESALQWETPETLPLSDLVQQQPKWATTIIPTLGRELKRTGQLPSGTAPTWDALAQLGFGSSIVQLARLTGDKQPEAVLTIDLEAVGQLATKAARRITRPHTLIFSAAGKLLYSECSTEAALAYFAIANLGNDGASAIVADGPSNYSLLRWSDKHKRFE